MLKDGNRRRIRHGLFFSFFYFSNVCNFFVTFTFKERDDGGVGFIFSLFINFFIVCNFILFYFLKILKGGKGGVGFIFYFFHFSLSFSLFVNCLLLLFYSLKIEGWHGFLYKKLHPSTNYSSWYFNWHDFIFIWGDYCNCDDRNDWILISF